MQKINKNILKITSKQRVKQGYMKFIYKNNPAYFVTLTFPFNTNSHVAKKLLNRFIINLNKKIYKKRYNNNLNHINGIAVREFTHELNCDHFHIIIFENDQFNLPEFEAMENKIEKVIEYINRSAQSKYLIKTFDIQECYRTGQYSLEKYVTKQFDGFKSVNDCGANMGLIQRDSVSFG